VFIDPWFLEGRNHIPPLEETGFAPETHASQDSIPPPSEQYDHPDPSSSLAGLSEPLADEPFNAAGEPQPRSPSTSDAPTRPQGPNVPPYTCDFDSCSFSFLQRYTIVRLQHVNILREEDRAFLERIPLIGICGTGT